MAKILPPKGQPTMGRCPAPVSHLLPPPPPHPPPPPPACPPSQPPNSHKTPNPKNTNRRAFLLSFPTRAAAALTTTLLLPATISNKTANADTVTPLSSYWVLAESYDPVTRAEKEASAATSRRLSEAVELLEKGRELQAQGDFNKALVYFNTVVENYKDFAFSEYARVGRALALYEVGDREEAIAEMEDVSISLKGYPEVHAALAAALYADKHAPLLAENQFTIATLLDPHYTDLSYVKETKHWPPSLVSSLQHFITLS